MHPKDCAWRFSGAPARIDGRFQFPVESYLLARGDAYAATYVPEAFVCLSESIDLHVVDPTRIRVPVTLVGILEDQLIPISDLRSLQARLGGAATLVELSSLYGHDAFLKESAALEPVFARALEGQGDKP
jgi:homoserine O-acetyltransferase